MKTWTLVLLCAAAITHSSGMDFDNSDSDFYIFKTFDGPLYDSDFHEPYETYGNSYSSEDNNDNSSSDENNEENENSKNAMVNEGDATKVIENNDDTSSSNEDNDEDNDSEETTVEKQKPVKKLKTVDPDQKKLKESGDYISPDDVEYRLTRQKRSKKPKSEEMDDEFDSYTQTYRDFVREHFTTHERDDASEEAAAAHENDASEETAAAQAAKVNKTNTNQSEEENNNEDDDENEEESDEAEDDVDYQHVKKLTEREAEESKRTPKYCKIIYKDDQECTVCKNPKTHDASESCSYSSSPAPKRYAFKRQKNYNSKDNDDHDHENDDKDDENAKKHVADDSNEVDEPKPRKQNPSSKKSKKNIKSKKTAEQNPVEEKLRTYENPHYYGNYYNNDRYTNSPLRSQTLSEYDDDLSFRASEPYVASTSSDGNVDKVLESFKNRDWSKCKHKREKGITCYYCKDKDGTTQEECMYSSDMDEDKPVNKKTHLNTSDFSIDKKATSTQVPFSLKDESVYKNPVSIIATFNNNQRKLNRDQNFKINPNINNQNYHVIQSSNNQQHQNRRSFNVGGPITTLEYIEPKNKITLKRMISSAYKVHEDNQQKDPIENKSLFYSKVINNNNGFTI